MGRSHQIAHGFRKWDLESIPKRRFTFYTDFLHQIQWKKSRLQKSFKGYRKITITKNPRKDRLLV